MLMSETMLTLRPRASPGASSCRTVIPMDWPVVEAKIQSPASVKTAVGAGASMKLAINLPLLVYWQSLGEALSLCKPLGLDPARLVDIISDTSGAPNVLKVRGASVIAALRGEDTGPITFDVDSVRKDLQTMVEEGKALGRTLPVVERALECFDQASHEGLGAKDCAMLSVRWAQRAVEQERQ